MAKPGDNSRARLVSFIERIERLKADKDAVANDIKDVIAEAKSAGFKPKILRNVLKIRSLDAEDFQQEMDATNEYLRACGMPEVDLSAAHDL